MAKMENNSSEVEKALNLERAKFADSYIGRMRTFKSQLLIWGVSLNFAAGAVVVRELQIPTIAYFRVFVAVLSIFVNILLFCAYASEHDNTNRLIKSFSKYLDFGVGSGSWNVYELLIVAFVLIQSFWLAILFLQSTTCLRCGAL